MATSNQENDSIKNQESSSNTNKGNFKNDPQKASEAGKKGGQSSS